MSDSSLSVDGVAPTTVLTPNTAEEIASALAEARERGQSVVPFGGGTLLHIGNQPTSCDIALSTRHPQGIVEYNPADLTVVARAGTTLAELGEELGRHGQFVPLDAPLPERSTLGGALAANASGPWRSAYGSGRDMVIGMRMALPSGEIARSGGKVVKNVAGYDLAKLFIGSCGTLGVIVEVALKVFPRPAETRTLLFKVDDLDEAFEIASRVRPVGPGVLALAVIDAALVREASIDGPAAVVTLGGSQPAVEDLAATVAAAADRVPAVAGNGLETALTALMRDFPAAASLRISTPPSRAHALAGLAGERFLSFPGTGLTYVSRETLDPGAVRDLRQQLAPERGHAVLLRASPEIKREVGVWGPMGPELALMRRVKEVFDPEGVMSPGRFVIG